jgi:hypothetical protein
MTLKELFKKYNAQPGFKFKNEISLNPYEVLYIGDKSVFTKDIHGGESPFDLDMEGYIKYEPPKKTKKIMVADYYYGGTVLTLTNDSLIAYPSTTKMVMGTQRQIEVECDE